MVSTSTRQPSPLLFYLVTALYWASMYVYVPILPVHAENLGASVELVGMIIGSYGFAQLLLRIPVGILSDRLGRRRPFLVAGMAATGLGALGLGLTGDPTWLVAWRWLTGAGCAAWVAFAVLFTSYYPPEKATRAMSRIIFVQGGATLVANYAGGLIAQHWGWHAPFFVAAGLGLLGAMVALLIHERPLPVRRDMTPRDFLRIASKPLLLWVSAATALTSWTLWATVSGFSLVYAARLGASRSDLGTLATLMQLGFTAGAWVSGPVADRLGVRWTVVSSFFLHVLGSVVVPMTDSLAVVGLTQLLGGLARGVAYGPLMAMSIRGLPPGDRATAMGVFQAIYALGMFGGPAASGAIGAALGLTSIFYVAALAAAAAILIVIAKLPDR